MKMENELDLLEPPVLAGFGVNIFVLEVVLMMFFKK